MSAREPGSVREADMTAVAGESVNMQKTSAEAEMPIASASVSEDVNQPSTAAAQHAGTVTAAALLPQSVPSTSPSTSTETKRMCTKTVHMSVCLLQFLGLVF